MKKYIHIILFCFLLVVVGNAFADEASDSVRIAQIMQVIENATPYETTKEDWEGEWLVEEWHLTGWAKRNWETYEIEEDSTDFHKEYYPKTIIRIKASSLNQGRTTVYVYKISLNDFSKSVMEIPYQVVDRAYNGTLVVEDTDSRIVIADGMMYFHIHLIGKTHEYWVAHYYGVGYRIESKKVLRDGVIYIERGDKTYTTTGAEL
ncbi:MAG: hypothetical protein IKN59_06250 [Paludibacteraceae bacterium]|nr:hypothetical protein [Paludibacteraceae bacterium]